MLAALSASEEAASVAAAEDRPVARSEQMARQITEALRDAGDAGVGTKDLLRQIKVVDADKHLFKALLRELATLSRDTAGSGIWKLKP